MELIKGLCYVTALNGTRLEDARNTGVPIEIAINDDVDRPGANPDTVLFLRPTRVGMEPAFDGQGWAFEGFVAKTRKVVAHVTTDALDPKLVQFVEGVAYPHTHTGRIQPVNAGDGNHAPGAEPWLVIAMHGQQHVDPVTRVMARSEAEAAKRANLTPLVQNRYAGRAGNGDSYICFLRRLADCASI